MVAHIKTFAFKGIEVSNVDVQVQVSSGLPSFSIVGMPSKSVGESKDRVRAAINSIGVALPPRRITVNLSPSDLYKEGSYYDLPIALGILVCLEIIDTELLDNYVVLGELSLDGGIKKLSRVLPASVGAKLSNLGLICPQSNLQEAQLSGNNDILAVDKLSELIDYLQGKRKSFNDNIDPVVIDQQRYRPHYPDLKDVKGQKLVKRAFEVAAAG